MNDQPIIAYDNLLANSAVNVTLERGTEDSAYPLSNAWDWDMLSPAYVTADAAGEVWMLVDMPRTVFSVPFGTGPFGYGAFGGYSNEARPVAALVLGGHRHESAGYRSVPARVQVELDPAIIDLDFMGGTLDPRLTFSRASTATYIGKDGLVKTAAINEPRFEYDPVTLEPLGYKCEPAATNAALWSNDFTNAVWVRQSMATAPALNSGVAPDGSNGAQLVTFDALAGSQIYQSVATFNADGTVSIWAKVSAGTKTFRLATYNATHGTQASADFIATTQWQRFSFRPPIANTVASNVYLMNGSSGAAGSLLVWEYQAELGAKITSNIPTYAAPVSRSADALKMPQSFLGRLHNINEYSVVVDFKSFGLSTVGARIFEVFINGANSCWASVNPSAGSLTINSYAGLAYQASVPYAVSTSDFINLASRYKKDSFAGSVNGNAVFSDNAGLLPIGSTILSIGCYPSAGYELNGHIRRLRLYDRALTDAELQALSADPDARLAVNDATQHPSIGSAIYPFTRTSAKRARIKLSGFEPGAQVVLPELYLGDVIDMPYLNLGFDPYPEVSQGPEFTPETGRTYPAVRYRRLEIAPSWSRIEPVLHSAIDVFRETAIENKQPWWWAWSPDSLPGECYLVRHKDSKAAFPFVTGIHRDFKLALVEAI